MFNFDPKRYKMVQTAENSQNLTNSKVLSTISIYKSIKSLFRVKFKYVEKNQKLVQNGPKIAKNGQNSPKFNDH